MREPKHTAADEAVRGASVALEAGMASIPYVLLKYYRQLELSDIEVLLLIQLLSFKQMEQNEFPTLDELQQRMGAAPDVIAKAVQRLIREKLISIDMELDEQRGIHYERYNLSGLYTELGRYLLKEQQSRKTVSVSSPQTNSWLEEPKEEEKNIFTIFEKEFGRPLSPMEYESISGWVDQDRYPEELILLALKEAVFAGKVHFRYIDRILLEWSRNRLRTAEEVKAYAQRFRTGGRG
ncbi:DnaD domain protein [Paenibacillus sp. JX-17]|uniref:DnaD domain protein n=1 Tax=Paenibacillus lacisoli TaxID=3064525 RepID=A0ABT9CBF4_9BACL|nr:DnaD domain protein [Paenibacillus sp. JX-17]MDO7905021.1 DnaD domain protein [Paenibacillus sp. JX-17]